MQLEEAYGVDLDLSQDGQCLIYGAQAKAARDAVNELVGDVEIGEVYGGVVLEQRDFGVVIEIMRNKEALLHVSELTDDPEVLKHPEGNAGVVRSLTALGQKIDLECLDVDRVRGWVKMSRKSVVRKGLQEGEKYKDEEMERSRTRALEEYDQDVESA